jgi:DTW domain-containing protein YfiP
VFVDSTWAQTHRIVTHERLAGLPRVAIRAVETLFWRPQTGKPSTHLATIEAIYQFFRQWHLAHNASVCQLRRIYARPCAI